MLLRRPRKPRLLWLGDQLLRRKRFRIETVNDQLQHSSQIAHSRHRRLTGCRVQLVGGLIA